VSPLSKAAFFGFVDPEGARPSILFEEISTGLAKSKSLDHT